MRSLLVVILISAGLAGCGEWRSTPEDRDVLRWHELQRKVAEINARGKARCEARHETYGLDAIGDPACLVPSLPGNTPVAPTQKK